MKTFKLKPDYKKILMPVLLFIVIVPQQIITMMKGGEVSSINEGLSIVAILLLVFGILGVTRKEKIVFDDEVVVFEDNYYFFIKKKISFSKITRIILFDKRIVLYTDRMFRKSFESKRFYNNDWTEFLAMMKKLPQFPVK